MAGAAILPLFGLGLLFAAGGSSAVAADAELAALDATLGHLPRPHPFPADSLIYDSSHGLIADVHRQGQTRLPISLSQVAPVLQEATVDTEDRHFWSGGFVDPPRILAAAWADLRADGPLQGASTITQQLAKVKYLNDSPTLARKLRELFVARRLEATMSKQQILQEYLNDIDYGQGAIGIEAAAHTYFNVDASKLDLAQASLLAGLPDAPTELDPLAHLEAAKARQQTVLDGMLSTGAITPAQAEQAYAEHLKFAAGSVDDIDTQPAFVQRVRQAIVGQLKLDPATAGLRVVTTLDPRLQQLAQQVVGNQVHALAGYNVTDGALVSIEPSTGNVLAYVGSAGPKAPGSDIDMAAVPRQPGSTFKLFTYSTAIQERKVTMVTPVLDGPFSLPAGGGPGGADAYVVRDYDLRYHGVIPVEMALGNSLNIPAVKVELLTGTPNIVRTARSLGVTTLDRPAADYTPSLTLGGYPVPLWELAQAGSALANGGKLRLARFVKSVADASGRQLLPAPPAPRQMLDPGVAFIMNQILTNDSNRVMEFGAHSALTLPGHVVAAKTGTTNDFKDNLTVGWTPKLVTATWVGNANDDAMHGTTGLSGAAPIWRDFMAQALAGQPDDWPGPPADVRPAAFDGHTGFVLDGTSPSWIPQLAGRLPAKPRLPHPTPVPASPNTSPSANPSPSASPAPSSPAQSQPPAALKAVPAAGTHPQVAPLPSPPGPVKP